MDYRLVIFDFDGTLADSAGWMIGIINEITARHRLRPVGRAEIEMLRGKTASEAMAFMDLPLWKLPAIARDVRRLNARDAHQIRVFDGVEALFARLAAAGVRIAVVSSNAEANVRRILGPALSAKVAHWSCGASLFGKAAKFRGVVKTSGVAPTQALSVGDETRDIEAARAAGLASAAVTWGYATAEALRAAGPTHLFESVEALAAALA